MLKLSKQLILASASPRRQQLLRQIGLTFRVESASIAEEYNGREPADFAMELSQAKARAVAPSVGEGIILAADTIVLIDDVILGKPDTPGEAEEMLKQLSGRMHEVITGFTLIDIPSEYTITDFESTRVWFRPLHEDEIRQYVQTGSPMDKAGAYGIQDDFGAVFVERIEGCYYNVVGLPLAKVYCTMKRLIEKYSAN